MTYSTSEAEGEVEPYQPKHAKPRCQHGNVITEGAGPHPACACMIIDKAIHPCRGCPPSCGNCL